jgi:methylmalonyl-CoA mutase N-terminal domain/subunit
MEDSGNTLLYIVIGLVILLVSAFGRKKKPSEAANKITGRPSSLEELAKEFTIPEFLQEEKETMPGRYPGMNGVMPVSRKNEPETFLKEDHPGASEGSAMSGMNHLIFQGEESVAMSADSRLFHGEGADQPAPKSFFQGETGDSIAEEGERLIDIMDEDYMKMTEIRDHVEEDETKASGILMEFDPVKAVIYSEILHRKYEQAD